MTSPDSSVIDGVNINNLDHKSLEYFRKVRNDRVPDSPEVSFNDKDLLVAYDLLNEGKLTVASVLLFGTQNLVERKFPQFRVDIIRIKGNDWGKDKDEFLSIDLKGNLLYVRAQAIDHIEIFFMTAFTLDENLVRVDVDLFKKALREAVSNLLMHQNYLHFSPSQIIIYNDRIEFRNPGYSLKDPSKYNIPGSEIRNALIAKVFYDIGFAETKGTGMRTQILSLKSNGYPEVYWENDKDTDRFALVFPYPAEQVIGKEKEQISQRKELLPGLSWDQVGTKLGLSKLETEKILKLCEEPRSAKELMLKFGWTNRTKFRNKYINPCIKKDLIASTLPSLTSPNQKYIITEKGRRILNEITI